MGKGGQIVGFRTVFVGFSGFEPTAKDFCETATVNFEFFCVLRVALGGLISTKWWVSGGLTVVFLCV